MKKRFKAGPPKMVITTIPILSLVAKNYWIIGTTAIGAARVG